jgi:ribonuclease BN (tRNA processing enzyme)
MLTAIPLEHSFFNLGLFIEKMDTDFTVLITGDWKGSSSENQACIAKLNPHLLVTECRYFEASKYQETEDRFHVHFSDLKKIKKELPDTTIAIAHVSRTYRDIQPMVRKCRKEGFIFAKKVLFYNNFADYEILEEF